MSAPFRAWEDSGGVRPAPITTYEILHFDGQSNAQGVVGTNAEKTAAGNLDPRGLLTLGGLKRSDGLDITVQGPQSLTYNTAVSATGLIQAIPAGYIPTGIYIGAALRRRRVISADNPAIIFQFHGIGGQQIAEFDDDAPLVTGTLGPHIHNNRDFWLSQANSVLAGKPVFCRYAGMIQGEGDRQQPEGAYYSAALETWGDWLRQIAEKTGSLPIPCATQIGGYADSIPGKGVYHVCMEQVRVIEDLNGIVLPSWYPIITIDNNIHHPNIGYMEGADACSYYLHEAERGRPIPSFRPTTSVSGNTITLTYPLRAGERLQFDESGKYDAYGGVSNQGFEVTGANISSVFIGGSQRNQVIIQCDSTPTGWAYAMQQIDVTGFADANGLNFGAHRGLLRKNIPIRPMLPGVPTMHQWALSWREAFG